MRQFLEKTIKKGSDNWSLPFSECPNIMNRIGRNSMKLSKKQLTEQWLTEHPVEQWGSCIHCGAELMSENDSLICKNNHRFDGAKQGYYFLTKRKLAATKYDRELFEARRNIIMETDLYKKLHERLIEIIEQVNETPRVIVDAGCGEGSHLAIISQRTESKITLLGVDLSKEGIQLATDYNGLLFPMIGDLSNLPIRDHSCDILLSILSPANYQEFNRILSTEGLLIKVIPNQNYLREIRDGLQEFGLIDPHEYDNTQVLEVFEKHYPEHRQINITDQVALSFEHKMQLLKMTPLAWDLDSVKRVQLAEQMPNTISLDLTILISR